MAISKILSIGDCGSSYHGKHLKQALDYIMEEYKTGNGKWISSFNCQVDHAYKQMHDTKVQFDKTDKRQGYHMIVSFAEGEVDAETAFEMIGKFVKEYLGQDYETVYAVHDNTEHVHGHIIFNSVSFCTGKNIVMKKVIGQSRYNRLPIGFVRNMDYQRLKYWKTVSEQRNIIRNGMIFGMADLYGEI